MMAAAALVSNHAPVEVVVVLVAQKKLVLVPAPPEVRNTGNWLAPLSAITECLMLLGDGIHQSPTH
ncbi:MAG: hypothetical protein VB824_01380 [Dehalococcoidia bacterium]|jgi:hypothetical protein